VLDRTGAMELIPMLKMDVEDARRKGKFQREADLSLLIDILDSYAYGRINLMKKPYVGLSNIT
jgi:hypothetical protein